MGFEINIPYTEEELRVMALPKQEQEKEWFKLFQNCDFEKDTILRICSMLETDGLLPMFHSEGIHIFPTTANEAYGLLKERGYENISNLTMRMTVSTKKKIRNGEPLSEEEKIYQKFLEDFDTAEEEDKISGKCYWEVYNYLDTSLYERCKKEDNMCDYLLSHITTTLSMGGILASGEKEFISQYFNNKEKEKEMERE